MEALFWASMGLVAFSYFGYPVALAAWDALRELAGVARYVAGGRDRRAERRTERWPTVTIAVAAYNEESCIRAKIENCLALDYPADKLEVLVGCDGCTDRTVEVAREVGGPRVNVLDLSPRSGKTTVLNRVVPAARGELVVLTDANVMLEPGAVKALARRFEDPAVGAVVGRLRLFNPVRREYEESLYWKYETLLKYWEGKHGAVLGANGGLYAIRRLLYRQLPADAIVDDFLVPVRILARGWRVPFEAEAVGHEETTEDYGREFTRRARIGAGNWQALGLAPELLDPRLGFVCFSFVSHKLLRWLAPFLLAAALAANVWLAATPGAWGWRALLAVHAGFYALALAGMRGAGGALRRPASIAWYFVSMNAALAVGLWRFVRGTQRVTWQRTERSATGVRAA